MVDDGAAMKAYYGRDEERDRLATGIGSVEFARTIEIVTRTLPPAPALVADVGGGPGRYTDWLVDHGYRVVHRDLIAGHVEQVRSRHGDNVDAAVGDARSLDLADASVDVVLLLGPLYHLVSAADRIAALREANRIVRSDGVVHAAAIARWTPRLDGILVNRFHLKHPALLDLVTEVERSGIVPPAHDAGFTGYTHTPQQLRDEVVAAGLELRSLVGLEGIAFALCDVEERMNDPAERLLLLDTLRAVEAVLDLLGLGPHLLATATRTSP